MMPSQLSNGLENQIMFDGEYLHGDDFSDSQIEDWFKQEEKSYYRISHSVGGHKYVYRAFDQQHFYSRFELSANSTLLSIGGADGSDFELIADSISEFFVVEIAEEFWKDTLFGKRATYIKPTIRGTLDFEDNTFDLVTCLSVMHHIPNVSYVLGELFRVLKPGGKIVFREPIVSMGDWTHARPGLTANERGIPIQVLRECIANLGFEVKYESFTTSPIMHHIARRLRKANIARVEIFNSKILTWIDTFISQNIFPNRRYHARKLVDKFGAQGIAFILEKPN